MIKKKNPEKKLSSAELAEGYIFPHDLSKAEKAKADQEYGEFRKKRLLERSSGEKLLSSLLQLRFELEDYIENNQYDPNQSFSFFLNEYLRALNKKKGEFAEEIDVHETKLSQVLNNKVEPNDKFIIRLELHSNQIFPAVFWFKLLEKKKEYELSTNKKIRQQENKHVKNRLELAYTARS